MFIQDFFRRRCLRRFASEVPTSITPLREIHSAVCFIDAVDTTFDKCKEDILAFFKKYGIKGDIFFFDFRKITGDDRLITSITTTVLKKDLSWIGRPSREKVNLMLGTQPDLFVSLIRSGDFPIEFMAKCSKARFKIGRVQLPGDTFDLVVADPEGKTCPEDEIFENITDYLKKIE